MWSEWLANTLERSTLDAMSGARAKARMRLIADLLADVKFEGRDIDGEPEWHDRFDADMTVD